MKKKSLGEKWKTKIEYTAKCVKMWREEGVEDQRTEKFTCICNNVCHTF